jgi:hypothetical protein
VRFETDGAGLTIDGTPLTPSALLTWQVTSSALQQAVPNHGYLLMNNSPATVRLPPNMSPGEIVRISSGGASGWTLTQNAGQSVSGSALGAFGAAWNPQGPVANWSAIASSADGNRLVAAAYGGQLYTSADAGTTWTARASSRNWFAVASSSDGIKLVAVERRAFPLGQVYLSTDGGASWTPVATPQANWSGVASSADGARLVIAEDGVGLGGDVYSSMNSGTTWVMGPYNYIWHGVSMSADGAKAVVVGDGVVIVSSDAGANWSYVNNLTNASWKAVAVSADGSKMVIAPSAGLLYTSADGGATWTGRAIAANWSGLAASSDGKRIAAIGGTFIYTSTDFGMTWTQRAFDANWRGLASSADGTRLVAVAAGGRIYTCRTDTSPGTTGSLTGEAGSALELQYVGGGRFIPLSHEGTFTVH